MTIRPARESACLIRQALRARSRRVSPSAGGPPKSALRACGARPVRQHSLEICENPAYSPARLERLPCFRAQCKGNAATIGVECGILWFLRSLWGSALRRFRPSQGLVLHKGSSNSRNSCSAIRPPCSIHVSPANIPPRRGKPKTAIEATIGSGPAAASPIRAAIRANICPWRNPSRRNMVCRRICSCALCSKKAAGTRTRSPTKARWGWRS